MTRTDFRRVSRRSFVGAALVSAAMVKFPIAGHAREENGKRPRSVAVNDPGSGEAHVVAFQKGDEIVSGLLAFVKEHKLVGGHFSAIGAVSDAVLAYFHPTRKEYMRIPIPEQAEVASLTGNFALERGQPFLHAHAVLGLGDGAARAGHLLEAHVWPTLEVVLVGWPKEVRRKLDNETGLYLLDV
jgi:predicted DNA-binding protein with PD1-like motif